MMERDALYEEPRERIDAFDFGDATARVFDDMLNRSVPFYQEIQRMVVELAGAFMKDGTRVYDLGCSTGTTMLLLAQEHGARDIHFIGVDNSEPMLTKTREKLATSDHSGRCQLILGDVNDVVIENASVAILVLTLQFVRSSNRDSMIRRLCRGLVDRGVVILVEKVLCNDPNLDSVFIDHYYAYKKRQGYSELEIAQKREALENVLVPYKLDENAELLSRNGFSTVEVFFRWYNFAGILGVKRSRRGKSRALGLSGQL